MIAETGSLLQLAWTDSQLPEAMRCLGEHLCLTVSKNGNPSGNLQATGCEDILANSANSWGMEVEAIQSTHSGVRKAIEQSSPSLIPISRDGTNHWLVVVRAQSSRLRILGPNGSLASINSQDVRHELCEPFETAVAESLHLDALAEHIRSAKVRKRAFSALVHQHLEQTRIPCGWILRCPPNSTMQVQMNESALIRRFAQLFITQFLVAGIWMLSWWLLGWATISGRLDLGWLTAWALALVTLVPIKNFVIASSGRLITGCSALVKRRLLDGALKMDIDQIRRQGVGELLGRVMEADALDAFALSGGFVTLSALIHCAMALFILPFGASGILLTAVFVAMMIGLICLGADYARRRALWSNIRLEMTHHLVQRMEGHKTRLAQQRPDEWHIAEDQELSDYYVSSRRLDRAYRRMHALAPRAWLVMSILALTPSLVYGDPSSIKIGIAIGGIALVYGAVRNLAFGAENVAAAWIAWQRVRDLWQASAQSRSEGLSNLANRMEANPNSRNVVAARQLSFRYKNSRTAVLENIDLDVQYGDKILLQGESGCGKSTFAAVMAALRPSDSGMLYCRGLDVPSVGETAWRKNVVLVPQYHENRIMMGSLAYNVLMGRNWPAKQQDFDEAERVCNALGLGSLVGRMPAGIHQPIGETGWQLSQGEQCRVFIARALLQQSELVILDESIGALDPSSLKCVVEVLIRQNNSIVLIAHP